MQKENFADDQEYDPSQWSSGLFTGSAKSQFDGSSYIFNFICFGSAFAIVRNYIRTGYGIRGRVGMSDCVISTFCWPCVIAQLLNEVSIRGPGIISIPSSTDSPWIADLSTYSCIGDPLDFCCTFLTAPLEVYTLYSQLAGVPFWFALLGSPFGVNLCQIRHLVRKSYGIGGGDCLKDCIQPTVCLAIPFINCTYLFKELAGIREEMTTRGKAPNFSQVTDDDVLPPTNSPVKSGKSSRGHTNQRRR